jgi:AcrR family transcriptional regulator
VPVSKRVHKIAGYDPFVADVRGEPALGLRERKKLRTRATLIDAAVELCERHGFDQTTVDQIAAIADVSPRTFSRYFPTKDAIALALIDEAIEEAAVELANQPPEVSHLDALHRSYVAMYTASKTAAPGRVNADRMMCTVRIIMSSPTLRQAATEYRDNNVEIALGKRMGVPPDDRRLKLLYGVWVSIVMTALDDLSDASTDWQRLTVDDVVARLEATYAEFTELMAGARQPF